MACRAWQKPYSVLRNRPNTVVSSQTIVPRKEVRLKQVVFEIHKYCSDPLNKDTYECIAYWNAIQEFNQEMDHVYHTIRNKESPYLCESFADMDKMYDL
jgi:hypothetical protein